MFTSAQSGMAIMSVMGCSWTQRGATWQQVQRILNVRGRFLHDHCQGDSFMDSLAREIRWRRSSCKFRSKIWPEFSLQRPLPKARSRPCQGASARPPPVCTCCAARTCPKASPLQKPRLQKMRFEVSNGRAVSYWWKDVEGDGRCGYRSLALARGVSWQQVLQEVLHAALQAPAGVFSTQQLLALCIASDPTNACPDAAWLTDQHISLLARTLPVLYPHGILVRCWGSGNANWLWFHAAGCHALATRTVVERTAAGWRPCVLGHSQQSQMHFSCLQILGWSNREATHGDASSHTLGDCQKTVRDSFVAKIRERPAALSTPAMLDPLPKCGKQFQTAQSGVPQSANAGGKRWLRGGSSSNCMPKRSPWADEEDEIPAETGSEDEGDALALEAEEEARGQSVVRSASRYCGVQGGIVAQKQPSLHSSVFDARDVRVSWDRGVLLSSCACVSALTGVSLLPGWHVGQGATRVLPASVPGHAGNQCA